MEDCAAAAESRPSFVGKRTRAARRRLVADTPSSSQTAPNAANAKGILKKRRQSVANTLARRSVHLAAKRARSKGKRVQFAGGGQPQCVYTYTPAHTAKRPLKKVPRDKPTKRPLKDVMAYTDQESPPFFAASPPQRSASATGPSRPVEQVQVRRRSRSISLSSADLDDIPFFQQHTPSAATSAAKKDRNKSARRSSIYVSARHLARRSSSISGEQADGDRGYVLGAFSQHDRKALTDTLRHQWQLARRASHCDDHPSSSQLAGAPCDADAAADATQHHGDDDSGARVPDADGSMRTATTSRPDCPGPVKRPADRTSGVSADGRSKRRRTMHVKALPNVDQLESQEAVAENGVEEVPPLRSDTDEKLPVFFPIFAKRDKSEATAAPVTNAKSALTVPAVPKRRTSPRTKRKAKEEAPTASVAAAAATACTSSTPQQEPTASAAAGSAQAGQRRHGYGLRSRRQPAPAVSLSADAVAAKRAGAATVDAPAHGGKRPAKSASDNTVVAGRKKAPTPPLVDLTEIAAKGAPSVNALPVPAAPKRHTRWLAELDSAPFTAFTCGTHYDTATACGAHWSAPVGSRLWADIANVQHDATAPMRLFSNDVASSCVAAGRAQPAAREQCADAPMPVVSAALADSVRQFAGAHSELALCSALQPSQGSAVCLDRGVVTAAGGWLAQWSTALHQSVENAKGNAVCSPSSTSRRKGRNKAVRKRPAASDAECDSSDSDSGRNRLADLANPLVLVGPSGVGKSALVYALAAEHGLRVIEVPPSEERTGRKLEKRFKGATHSHRVLPEHKAAGLKAAFACAAATVNRSNSDSSLSDTAADSLSAPGNQFSVILLDEADLNFDEPLWPCGVWPAAAQLSLDSRVPIVLTCNDGAQCTGALDAAESFDPLVLQCHAQRRALLNCLHEVCTALGADEPAGLAAHLLGHNGCDVRRSLTQLHAYGTQLRTHQRLSDDQHRAPCTPEQRVPITPIDCDMDVMLHQLGQREHSDSWMSIYTDDLLQRLPHDAHSTMQVCDSWLVSSKLDATLPFNYMLPVSASGALHADCLPYMRRMHKAEMGRREALHDAHAHKTRKRRNRFRHHFETWDHLGQCVEWLADQPTPYDDDAGDTAPDAPATGTTNDNSQEDIFDSGI